MGLMSAMRRLDEAVVPRLARGLTRVRRRRVRPLTIVAAVLLVAVAATGVWRLVRPEPGGGDGTSPLWVGVRDGDSVPRYIDAASAELSALAAAQPGSPVYALVSFREYRSPGEVAAIIASVAGITPVHAYARVPLPDRQTQRVRLAAQRLPDDLVADMVRVADRKNGDAATYERMAQNEPGVQLKEIYRSNAEVSRAEANAFRDACACVFALLVRGSPDALTTLSGRPEVRVVDPAAAVADPDDAVFSAPLPEQTDRVQPPADSLPS